MHKVFSQRESMGSDDDEVEARANTGGKRFRNTAVACFFSLSLSLSLSVSLTLSHALRLCKYVCSFHSTNHSLITVSHSKIVHMYTSCGAKCVNTPLVHFMCPQVCTRFAGAGHQQIISFRSLPLCILYVVEIDDRVTAFVPRSPVIKNQDPPCADFPKMGSVKGNRL